MYLGRVGEKYYAKRQIRDDKEASAGYPYYWHWGWEVTMILKSVNLF
jgi:hypothetical protein